MAVLILSMGLTGCMHQASSPSAPSAQTVYQKSAVLMDDFATDLQQAQGVVVNLHRGGAIDTPTYTAIQGYFSQIAGYGIQIDSLIAAQAEPATIAKRISSAVVSLNGIANSTGKIDPGVAAQVQAGIQALTLLLNSLSGTLIPASISFTETPHGPSCSCSPGRAASLTRLHYLPAGESQPRWSSTQADRRNTGRRRHEIRPNYRGGQSLAFDS
jgi:hypothetical protein